jgi:hypothetical protein
MFLGGPISMLHGMLLVSLARYREFMEDTLPNFDVSWITTCG